MKKEKVIDPKPNLKQKIKKFAKDFRAVQPGISLSKKEDKQLNKHAKCLKCGAHLLGIYNEKHMDDDYICLNCGTRYELTKR